MPASAQSEASTMNTGEKTAQFYYLPVLRYRIEMQEFYDAPTKTVLMDIGGRDAFVTYTGRKPTPEETTNGAFFEGQVATFVEANSQEEAWQKFVSMNPGAQGKSPAMVLNKRPGRKITLMPVCDEMARRNGEVLCNIRISEGIGQDQCGCIVQSGWPPYDCPFAKAINFDFVSPPLPWANQPPF